MYFNKFLTLLMLAVAYNCHAQVIETATAQKNGVRLRSGTAAENARFIIQVVGARRIEHTPESIDGYRLPDGRTYRAFTVQTRNGERERYFLEQLAKDSIQFYYLVDRDYREVYYMSSDGSPLKELAKEELNETLKKATENCPGVSENARYVKLTRHHLARFGEDYKRCTNRAFPRFRIGVKGAISQNTYNQKYPDENSFFPMVGKFSGSGFSIGMSVDRPIKASNWSLNVGPTLDYYHGSERTFDVVKAYNLMFDDLQLSVPVFVRYGRYGSLITPFVEAGIIYSQHLSGTTTLYEFQWEGNNVFLTQRDEFSFVPKQQFGVGIAAGVVVFSREKYSILLQGGYRMMRPLNSTMISTHVNVMSLSTGFLF